MDTFMDTFSKRPLECSFQRAKELASKRPRGWAAVQFFFVSQLRRGDGVAAQLRTPE
jgi:hypothetical protein